MRIPIQLLGQISHYNSDHPKTPSSPIKQFTHLYPSKTQPNDNNFIIKITFSYTFWNFLDFFIFSLFLGLADGVFLLADDLKSSSLRVENLQHGFAPQTKTCSWSYHFDFSLFFQNGYQQRVYSEQSLLHMVFKAFKEEKYRLHGGFRHAVLNSEGFSLFISLCSRGESGQVVGLAVIIVV